jgi:hypothetical protein
MNQAAAFEEIELEFKAEATRAAIAELGESERELLRGYWVDRARGELTTALTFEFMLADLLEEAAPRELVTLAETAIADEHRHVDWCLRWANFIDDREPAVPELSGTRPVEFEGASAHDNRLLRTVFGCCFSETVAVHVLERSHALITLPSVRRLNHEHLKEEVGHARLGWALAGWPALSARDRDMLGRYVPEMARLVRMVWQSTERVAHSGLHELGYLSSPIIDPACDEALDGVIMPGLAKLGIVA